MPLTTVWHPYLPLWQEPGDDLRHSAPGQEETSMELDGQEAARQSTPSACQTDNEPMEGAAPRQNPREPPPYARLAPHPPRPRPSPPCAEVPSSTNLLDAEVARVISVSDKVMVPPGGAKLAEKLTHGLLLRALEALEAGLHADGGRDTSGRPFNRYFGRLIRDVLGKKATLTAEKAQSIGNRLAGAAREVRIADAARDEAARAAAHALPYPGPRGTALEWGAEPAAPPPPGVQ